MYTTRYATQEDIPVLVKCWTSMTVEMSESDGVPFPEATRIAEIEQLFREKMTDGDMIFRVAVDEKQEIVASVGGLIRDDYAWPLSANTERVGWVVSVYTEPAHRKHRLAYTLVQETCEWLKSNQINMIRLWASQAGKPTYKKLGFNEMSFMDKYIEKHNTKRQ